ncbi:hypothetical protein HML84_16955 [Alcanivorax sp. IO_7]|nr:hypothetical protein HML84_16955 [Alcanivorax sp. IO_7]
MDDDDELRAMLGATLEAGGCRVLGARDGEEAWRVIARGGFPMCWSPTCACPAWTARR